MNKLKNGERSKSSTSGRLLQSSESQGKKQERRTCKGAPLSLMQIGVR
jgi:hypothetical protein